VGDGQLESFGTDSFDDTRFASMIRESLRGVVEATLVRVPGSAEHRHEVRAASERLGNALVGSADAPDLPETTPTVRMRTADATALACSGASGHARARAFRVMAGVRP
jgi:hypothetical protein